MKKMQWFLLLAALMMVLPACALVSQGSDTQILAPSATPLPPTADLPTSTPYIIIVTPTPAPTDTPLPATATYTVPPRPTNTPRPTATPAPTTATVLLSNGLAKPIKVDLSGPESRSFSVSAKSEKEFEVKPGTYSFIITASGFYPLRGTITFKPGFNTWDLGKSKP